MWNVLKSVGVALGLVSSDNDQESAEYAEEEKKILNVLEAIDSDDDDDINNIRGENEIVAELCSHRVGYVTHFNADCNSGMIDSQYYFDMKNAPSDVQIGDRVSYIAFRKNEQSMWIIKNIYAIQNEQWENSSGNSDAENEHMDEDGKIKKKSDVETRSIVGKVVERNGRQLLVQPGNYSLHLDKVSTTFIPIKGDWLLLKTLVEVDDDVVDRCGEVLQIDSIMPLRFRSQKGTITHWEPSIKSGIVDSLTYFSLDACEQGYIPEICDKVLVEQIESEQDGLMWRALTVIPLLKQTKFKVVDKGKSEQTVADAGKGKSMADVIKSEKNRADLDILVPEKNGISITELCTFGDVEIGSEKELVLYMKNCSMRSSQLLEANFKMNKVHSQTQIKLISPFDNRGDRLRTKPFYINANDTVKFVFRITPRHVGKSTELFIWKFKNFEIGRRITVNVVDSFISEVKNSKLTRYKKSASSITAQKIFATKNGFVMSAEKTFRPAAFVPIKLGHFPVPNRLWEGVLGVSEDTKSDSGTIMRKIIEAMPCLGEPLNETNYRKRWHALIYLEEISNVVNMRRYDLPRAHFVKNGDYLVLEVPGLAEKRPSLICGDLVIATNPCSVSNEKDVKYEGAIHKICRNEIWIRFNKLFHESYNGADYMIIFNVNRICYRRCHQAVDVALNHLTTEWLFPSSLKLSEFPVIIKDDEAEDNNLEETNKINENQDNACNLNKSNHNDNSPNSDHLENNNIDSTRSLSANPNLSNLNELILNTSSNDSTKSNNTSMEYKNSSLLNQSMSSNGSQNKNNSPISPRLSVVERLKMSLANTSDSDTSLTKPKLTGVSITNIVKMNTKNIAADDPANLLAIASDDKNRSSENYTNNNAQGTNTHNPSSKHFKKLNTLQTNTMIQNGSGLLNFGKTGTNFCMTFDRRVVTEQQLGSHTRTVPKANMNVKKIKWFNPNLNWYQKQAVINILRREACPLPYIIFGPPGTGKTITLVETALQILNLFPDSRLLIGTPSNSAANLICERMLLSGLLPPGMLVRLCSHHYLSNDNCNISDLLRPYCTVAEIKVIEADLANTVEENSRGIYKGMSRDVLGRHRVTVGTCVTLGVLYNLGFPQGHFTHILVDEAGQATEPEILIPLAFLDDKYGQTILAGDPMQLGPVVQSQYATKLGMEESFLVRLLNRFPYTRDTISFPDTCGYDPRIITRLVNNYRSLPEILKLPSDMFYENALIPQVNEVNSFEAESLLRLEESLPKRESTIGLLPPAIIFHGVRGLNYQDKDSPSWFNPQEVVQTIDYFSMLLKNGFTSEEIGIITPYQKQVTKIRCLIMRLGVPQPKVGSVEEFQGQERLAIILSAVRSSSTFMTYDAKHSLGFVSSPQRLNVALTRARSLLVVLGNPHLLNCDPYWRTVLKYCIKNKAYCGCDLPPELE